MTDAAVDDGQLAMVAIVEPSDVAERDLVEPDDADARLAHLLIELLLHSVSAGGVDEQPHLHALPRLRFERARELLADPASAPDECLEMDRLPRRGDVADEPREESVAVFEKLDAVARIDARLGQSGDRRQERVEIAGFFHAQVGRVLAPDRPEHHRRQRDGEQQREEEDERHADVMRPADVLDPAYLALLCHSSSAMAGQ